MDLTAILSKMCTFVLLLVLGYIFARKKITGPEFTKACSKLVINLFLTATILGSVINKEMTMTGAQLGIGIAAMFGMFAVNLVIGYLTPKVLRIKDGDIAVYRLLLCYMNSAFIGYPIVEAVYGADAIFYASTSNIPFNLTLYTLGVTMLRGGSGETKLRLRDVFSVPLIATLLAVVLFIVKPQVPAIIEDAVNTISGATVPLSMMLVGSSLGAVKIKDAITEPRLYVLSLVRLIVCPVAIWLIMRFFISDPVMLGTIVIIASTPMAVVITPLGIEYGRDGIESSKGIFISTVLSMITMPLLIMLLL